MTMQAKNKFGMAEAVALLGLATMSRMFLSFPRYLVEHSGPAAWLSVLSGFVMILIQIYIFSLLLRPHPEKNLIDVTRDALGKFVGTAVNITYAIYLLSVAAIFTRTFSEALLVTALPETPISVVSIGYVSMALLGAYLGLSSLARATRVVYPFVLIGMSILMLALIPEWEFTQLLPLLGQGPYPVFLKGGIVAGGVSEILMAAIIVQNFYNPGMFGMITLRAMVLAFAYLLALEIVLLLVFNHHVIEEYNLPFYELARMVHLGRFFQRLESIFIIIWGFIGMIKVSLCLYCASVTFSKTFKLPDYRPLLWALILIIFITSLLPLDMPTAIMIESFYIRIISWIPCLGLPLVVLAADRIRRRGGNK